MNNTIIILIAWLFPATLYATEKPTVAVLDFTIGPSVGGKITVTTNNRVESAEIKAGFETSLLTNKLVAELLKTQKLIVLERSKIESVMQEINLTQAELTDPDKRVRIGKLLGADYLVMGSISILDGKITNVALPYNAGFQRITEYMAGAEMRIVQTETGVILTAKNDKVKRSIRETNPIHKGSGIDHEFSDSIFNLLSEKLVNSVMECLFPIKVAAYTNKIVYLNRGELKVGTNYTVYKLGDLIIDPDTDEVLGQTETEFAIVEITEAIKNLSKGKILKWLTDEKDIEKGYLCRMVDREEDV